MTRLTRPLARLLLAIMLCAAMASHADELAEVRRLHYAGQTTEALQQADQFLAAHPTDAAMRFLKGVMLADDKQPTAAIEVFEALTQDHPDLAEPYNNLAALYAARGEYGRAREALARALRADPTYATAHENLGDVYAALAAQSYARALQLAPNTAGLASKLARARELFGDRNGAAPPAPPPTPASGAASAPGR